MEGFEVSLESDEVQEWEKRNNYKDIVYKTEHIKKVNYKDSFPRDPEK